MRPYNPNIASAFFRAGLVETWGRGIATVQQICRAQGYPEPEFEVLGEDLLLRQLKNIAWNQRQIGICRAESPRNFEPARATYP